MVKHTSMQVAHYTEQSETHANPHNFPIRVNWVIEEIFLHNMASNQKNNVSSIAERKGTSEIVNYNYICKDERFWIKSYQRYIRGFPLNLFILSCVLRVFNGKREVKRGFQAQDRNFSSWPARMMLCGVVCLGLTSSSDGLLRLMMTLIKFEHMLRIGKVALLSLRR